jgi:hypothetical protein
MNFIRRPWMALCITLGMTLAGYACLIFPFPEKGDDVSALEFVIKFGAAMVMLTGIIGFVAVLIRWLISAVRSRHQIKSDVDSSSN